MLYCTHIFVMMHLGMYINTKDRRKKTLKFADIIYKYLFCVNPKVIESLKNKWKRHGDIERQLVDQS
jgi:hypothetical protein